MNEKLEVTKTPDFNISYSETKVGNTTHIRHYHDAYEIAFFIKADLQVFIKDMKYDIGDGDLLFVDEYDIHHIIYNETAQYTRYVINFKKEFILPVMKAMNIVSLLEWFRTRSYKVVHLNLKDRADLQLMFDNIWKASKSRRSFQAEMSHAKIISNLMLILVRINELLGTGYTIHKPDRHNKLVQDIIRYIDANYLNRIELDYLENNFYTDKFHISHLFKKVTGLTVVEYIQYRRIVEAQKMLRDTDRNIIDIYCDCGFNNAQHFYRVFKKVTKMTPDKYRRLKK